MNDKELPMNDKELTMSKPDEILGQEMNAYDQGYRQGYIEASKKHEWISIKKRMPHKDGLYLAVEDHYAKWIGLSMMKNGIFDMPVSHWMNLPESPNE